MSESATNQEMVGGLGLFVALRVQDKPPGRDSDHRTRYGTCGFASSSSSYAVLGHMPVLGKVSHGVSTADDTDRLLANDCRAFQLLYDAC